MKTLTTDAEIEQVLMHHPAVLVLFGGAHCGVCQAIKPQLDQLVAQDFPRMESVYIDCAQNAGQVCAGRGIFSLPVVQIWFEGQHFGDHVRVFSMRDIRSALERPYKTLFGH